MKNIDAKIQESVAKVDLRKPESVQAAANAILTEELYVDAGETVVFVGFLVAMDGADVTQQFGVHGPVPGPVLRLGDSFQTLR